MSKTVLDTLLSNYPISCQVLPITVGPDELVHVVGAQEPVRNQPDERARVLLEIGWLRVEVVQIELPDTERASLVTGLQQAARVWQKQNAATASPTDREQIRWLVEKTRPKESNQQIAQRTWLALVLHNLGYQGLVFDAEGQIHWETGGTARIGLSPDTALDLAWAEAKHQVCVASFRLPDGTITRGKGRNRWHVYRLTVDPAATVLFERRAVAAHERLALIVASETFATQPQLPRNFYGGDEFQQACIDAQDQQFKHILVLSPAHGIISLDETVPYEKTWEQIIERRIWSWQSETANCLGWYLFGQPTMPRDKIKQVNWWAWFNPHSTYEVTVFGRGFAVSIVMEYLFRMHTRAPDRWPRVIVTEERDGYDIGDLDEDFDDFGSDFDLDEDLDEDFAGEPGIDVSIEDINQLFEWAAEFVSLVTISVPPLQEVWELAPDEALLPVRLLNQTAMDIENLLDLLTDMTLLLGNSLPFTVLTNSDMIVSLLLQIIHSLVHNDRDTVHEALEIIPESTLQQYLENVLQEPTQEDQLCGCLSLAEQIQLLSISIPSTTAEQLSIWLQTYLSARMRQRFIGQNDQPGTGKPPSKKK